MFKKLRVLIVIFSLTGCASAPPSPVLFAPNCPEPPALNHPELMDKTDKKALADFYREYEIFMLEYQAYKRIWRNE